MFGIELPKTVKEVYALDAKNGYTLWVDPISKEMENVRVAFKVLPDWKSSSILSQFVQCHMVFDFKIKGFKCKARLVAGGHIMETPVTIMYTSVVSRETVRIALIIAAFNDLEVKLGNILNAYVQAPATEKV